MSLEFVRALEAHIPPIAERMRAADIEEAAAFGHSPANALMLGLIGGEAWTVLVDGVPEAMFGWVVTSAIERECAPWMLGTDAIYRHGRELVKIGPEWLSRMFDSSRWSGNLVSATNVRAIRLLERWGFVVERETKMIGGVAFRMFWQERPDNL